MSVALRSSHGPDSRRHLSVVLACAVSSVVLLLVATTQAATEPSVGTTILYREWYTGDGLGVNITLSLQDDYIYRATWDGCLGRYGSASGTWSRTGDIVDLAPDREDGMLEEFLIKLQLVSTPDGPRLRLLQQHDNGDWTRDRRSTLNQSGFLRKRTPRRTPENAQPLGRAAAGAAAHLKDRWAAKAPSAARAARTRQPVTRRW